MAVERYGSKTDVVVKLILVFFISLLSFTVGTYVGKKFSDNQHKISQLEPMETAKDREVASLRNDGAEVKPKNALNDEEIKKLAEEFVAEDEHKKPTEVAGEKSEKSDKFEKPEKTEKAEKKDEHPSVAPTHASEPAEKKTEPAKHESAVAAAPKAKASEVVNRIVAGKEPEAEPEKNHKEKDRVPQSLPKELASTAIGKFTVQLAAFPDEAEAQKLANELKEKGFSAFYVTAKVKDKKTGAEKNWYRVSVGLFSTLKEADAYKSDLMSRAKVSSAIVQKITN